MRITAPGKVVLLGEYAVLDGAPALVAAVDRGVICEVSPGDAITTPGDDRFVRAALAGAPPARYAFSAYNPPPTAAKVGLGTSAAATVAAVLAAGAVRGEAPAAADLQARAAAIHRAVQGGGSGIDVAASAHGGVLRFTGGRVDAASAPPFVVVWSGEAAATGPRVARYQAWAGREAFARASAAVVEAFEADPLGAVREGAALLSAMAREAALPYRTPGLDRISALAERFGGVAKPSGAGGGDAAVAWIPDPDAEAAFLAACAAEGLVPVPVSVAPGAHVEPT